MRWIASMLIPARRDATFTEAHTRAVCASTSGSDSMTTMSVGVVPLCTRAVNPPTRSMPQSATASSRVRATSRAVLRPCPARMCVTGEMASRLLVMGMPYLVPIRSQVSTRRLARAMILVRSFLHRCPMPAAAQSSTFSANVTVRTSRCSA